MSALHPDSGDLRMLLALTYAKLGDKSKTYDLLLKMKAQGYGVDLKDDPRFEKVTGTEAWDYVVQNLQLNLQPFGEGKVAFELPKGDTLFESIAWDPKRQKFLVGSVRDGQVRIADKNGKLSEFITPADGSGLWSVYRSPSMRRATCFTSLHPRRSISRIPQGRLQQDRPVQVQAVNRQAARQNPHAVE